MGTQAILTWVGSNFSWVDDGVDNDEFDNIALCAYARGDEPHHLWVQVDAIPPSNIAFGGTTQNHYSWCRFWIEKRFFTGDWPTTTQPCQGCPTPLGY